MQDESGSLDTVQIFESELCDLYFMEEMISMR
jgi:hypothetical protein